MLTHKAIITNAAIVLFFCVVLLLLSAQGARNRVFLTAPRIAVVPQPHDALAAWSASGVRGRILLLFDRSFNITYPGSLAPDMTPDRLPVADNYVYLSTVRNITRMIYHVVPDAVWDRVSETLSEYPMVRFDGARFTMVVYDGIPLTVSRIRDLPSVPEQALVLINGTSWTDRDIADILALLDSGRIRSDLMTLSGTFSDRSLKELKAYARAAS
jgi:hypothetical protein